jgi:hypothetical protein
MAKLGRPTLLKRERNSKMLGVRFTTAERRMLDGAAQNANASLSEWARNVLLAEAQRASGEQRTTTTRSNPTDGVPHGARTTEANGRTYWMEQTRGEPRPQVTVVDVDTGEIEGHFYPIRRGFPHVAYQPPQSAVLGEIANRFSHGI